MVFPKHPVFAHREETQPQGGKLSGETCVHKETHTHTGATFAWVGNWVDLFYQYNVRTRPMKMQT